MAEHLKYVQSLPTRIKKRVRTAVAQANDEMIQRAVQRYGPLDPAVFKRLKEKGAEMHDNLLITDQKYFYPDADMFAQRIYETGRRDLDWFLSQIKYLK